MPQEDSSHYYEWDVGLYGRPFTTDPRHAATLESGPHNRVTLDGADAGMVTRCQTGREGWVEVIEPDENGRYPTGEDGRVLRTIRRGVVRFEVRPVPAAVEG